MSRTYCHTHSKYDCPTCADEILSLGIQADKDRIAALEREIDELRSRIAMTPDQIKVPEKKVLPELLMAEYHEAKGWNACVESMLSAIPEGKK